jgi:hypothetical protein
MKTAAKPNWKAKSLIRQETIRHRRLKAIEVLQPQYFDIRAVILSRVLVTIDGV